MVEVVEKFIRSVPLFRSLSGPDMSQVVQAMSVQKFEPGSQILKQGDTGDAFYVVAEGQCNVMVKPADFIKVADEIRVLNELTFVGKLIPVGTLAKVDKVDPSRNYPYTVCVHGTGQRGRVLPEEIGLASGNPEDKFVAKLKAGDYFGEQSLLKGAPRNATIITTTPVLVAVMDWKKFEEIKLGEKLSFLKRKAVPTLDNKNEDVSGDTNKTELRIAGESRLKQFIKIIDGIQLFDCLLSDEKQAVADALVETQFVQDDVIMKEGEEGDAFYILTKGQISFSENAEEISYMDASKPPEEGCFFGERSLLKKEPRAATATVTSVEAVSHALTKDRFEEVLGSLEELEKQYLSAGKCHDRESRVKAQHEIRATDKVLKEDLKSLGLLGCGTFGTVTLERHKTTGNVYALKMLSKGYIMKTQMEKDVQRERDILAMCDSDFVIKLYATFKDTDHLYFLLEAAMGGELHTTYHKFRFHGSRKKAKYYSAAVVYCFEHLHARNILYRDLKPENLLLSDRGHLKITDMGLAKVVVGKTYTTCGTPDYFAPEVIQQTGLGKGGDWWTLGVLIHELMSGHTPFEAKDPMKTYEKIVRGVNRVKFTYVHKDADAVDLVKNMLRYEPSERLPMREGGTKNIKVHKWFSGFEWELLGNGKLEPPYKPSVKSETDMKNFRALESDLPPQIPYKDDGSGWDANF